jgi:hypothetical protein
LGAYHHHCQFADDDDLFMRTYIEPKVQPEKSCLFEKVAKGRSGVRQLTAAFKALPPIAAAPREQARARASGVLSGHDYFAGAMRLILNLVTASPFFCVI